MALNIGGLGAFAGGTAQGLERGQFMSVQEQRIGLANAAEQRLRQAHERQTKLDARQDRALAADDEARAAATNVISEAQRAYEQQWQTPPMEGPGLGGGVVQPAPMQPFQPDEKLILKAAKAHYDTLFKQGRTDEAVKAWSLTEAKRIQMRSGAAQKVLASLQMGGDIRGALAAFDDTIDNGHAVKSVEQKPGPDGRPVYVITRVDDAGNETPPMSMSGEQMASMVRGLAADPKEAEKFALQEKLAVMKHRQMMDEISERERLRREREIEVDDHETGNKRKLIGARVSGDLTVEREKARLKDGGSGDGGVKTLTEARRAADTAQSRLRTAEANAIKIHLDNDDGQTMTAAQRRKLVDADPAVKEANAEYQEAREVMRRMQSGSTLKDATQPRGLPAGSKQIGTSGGKPVYQTPDGKKFIAD